jgi:putative hydrolase of the HAD superfamily
VLLDWGDTVMRVIPEYDGPMESWPEVEAAEGVREAITSIRRNALVCLATNAADSGEREIRNALERVGLNELFDRVFCFEVVGFRKPSEAYFRTVLELLELSPDRVFMVGDDFFTDVAGANAVGIRSVWFNNLSAEDRSGAFHATIHSLDKMAETLEALGFNRA